MVADDLDRVLVGTDGAIAAEAPEHARGGAGRFGDDHFIDRQRKPGHVVVDADGEVVGALTVQMLVDREHHRRGELLAGEAVAAADHGDVLVRQGGLHVEEQRFAERAGFLAAVEHRDLFDGRGQRLHEHVGGERTVQPDLQQAELLSLGVQIADRFFDRFAAGTHRDDDLVRIGGADIVEEVERTAGDCGDLVHVLLHDGREFFIGLVGGLAALEVDVGVLGGHLGVGSFRTQRAVAEALDVLHVDQFLHIRIVEQLDLLEFMRSAETVEEREERDFAFEGREVGDQCEVVGFLNGRGRGHRETGGTAAHHVGMVAEDRQRLGGQGAGRNVEDGREHFTGDLVHVRDHQQQTLRSGVGGGQRTRGKRTVHGTRGAGFGLHFHDFELLTEHVLQTLAGPGVGVLAHRRGRGDRVDRRDFAECVRNVRRSVVPVDGQHFLCHDSSIGFGMVKVWFLLRKV